MKSKTHRARSSAAISTNRWLAYATAGAATTVGAVNTAEADIVYSGQINQAFTGAPQIESFALAGTAYFVLGHLANGGGFAGFYIAAGTSAMFRGSSGGSYRYPSKLGPGATISMGNFVTNVTNIFATLASNGGADYGNFLAAGEGFIGFKFNSGAGTQYGWVRVIMDGSASGNTFTLVDYAYAGPGEPITAGQVPEPGTLAFLALGAVGLLVWRKHRAQAAA